MYKIKEIFNNRLSAITFYKSIYDFTIKFKVLTMEVNLEEEEDYFKVYGNVFMVNEINGITEVDIVNHIKNKI